RLATEKIRATGCAGKPRYKVRLRPCRRLVADHHEVVLVVGDGFGRTEIEDGPAIRVPAATVEAKDSRGSPQVADGFDAFHQAAFDRLEGDRYADKGTQFGGGPIAGIRDVVFEVTFDPAQTAGLAAVGSDVEEARFK